MTMGNHWSNMEHATDFPCLFNAGYIPGEATSKNVAWSQPSFLIFCGHAPVCHIMRSGWQLGKAGIITSAVSSVQALCTLCTSLGARPERPEEYEAVRLQAIATSTRQHGDTMAPQDELHHAMALSLTM